MQFRIGGMTVFVICFIALLVHQISPVYQDKFKYVKEQYHLVPILCFHDVDGPGPYALSRYELRYYLEAIKQSGVTVVSLKKLLHHAKTGRLFDKPTITITIDDNYKNIVRVAAPLLREYNYPATFFFYTNAISRYASVGTSWMDLNRLFKEGFEIQNHSHTHSMFHKKRPGESEASYNKRLYREIVMSRNILEKNIKGLGIYAFAYPMGYSSKRLHNEILGHGYEVTLTTDAKPVNLSRKFNGVFHRYTIQKRFVKNPEKMFRLQLQYANRIYKSVGKSSLSHSVK